MRMLNKNEQILYYAKQSGVKVPIYEKNLDGSVKYIVVDGVDVPVDSGKHLFGYTDLVRFEGNISFGGGETRPVEFGIDVSSYDAVLVMPKNALELTETSLIWVEGIIGYLDAENTIADPTTASYKVKKITPSINQDKYLLERVVNNGKKNI